MADVNLTAQIRDQFGKGAARRARAAGSIPAILYERGGEPIHLNLPGHETFLALKQANVLFAIQVDGEEHLAVATEVQRNPVKRTITHVDLYKVRRGEKIEVEVPIIIVGESAPGTIHFTEAQTLTIEAEATNLPESIEVSIEGMEADESLRAGDIELPEGSTLISDEDTLLVMVQIPQEEPAEDETDEAEGVEPAEPEAEHGGGNSDEE